MYQAVMDIGTNTSRLIVAHSENGREETVARDILTTRIGQGLGGGNLRITPEAARRTLDALKRFKEKMAPYPIERIWLGAESNQRTGRSLLELYRRGLRIGQTW